MESEVECMTLEFTEVVLENIPSYICSVSGYGGIFTLKFTWIERLRKRALTITGVNGETYLQNTVLSEGVEYKFTSKAIEDGYDLSISLLLNDNKQNNSRDFYNWKDNYLMFISRGSLN